MDSVLIVRGEIIYNSIKEKVEKEFPGKIIAIDVESKTLAGVGDTIDEVCDQALKKFPNKQFYIRKVGPCPAPAYLFLKKEIEIAYKNDMPMVDIKVIGPKEEREYQAYLDTGAMKTLIPEKDAILLGLTYSGDMPLITGTGKDTARLYKARILFLEEIFDLYVIGKDLPEQSVIRTLIGRDILDKFQVSFNGISKKIKIVKNIKPKT